MPIDLWVVEVHHTHDAAGRGAFAGINPNYGDCEYTECPGLGWNSMSEAWWHPPQKLYGPAMERCNMKARPLEECIARCYTQRGFLARHTYKGATYRIRNTETGEVIPVEALGV